MTEHAMGDHATEFLDAAEAMRIEDTVWWCVGRQAILKKYLERARREAPLTRIAEIGCGSGGNLRLLAEYGEVTGVERSAILADRARSRGAAKRVYVGDYFELDLAGDFQMTCLFDVLEHIDDDESVLGRLSRTVRPGHLLLLSVPACPFLFGPHDRLLHHHRRYSKRRLEELLRGHGYTILKGSHFLFFMLPIAVGLRLMERLRARWGKPPTAVQLGVVPAWANTVLTVLLRAEATIAQVRPLPVGLW